MPEKTFSLSLASGVTLRVYQAGTGPDVLLLHGTAGSASDWQVQMEQLVAAGYRVTAPDGRGHGLSDRATDYSNTAITHDAQALIAQLGLATPHVIGFSMGGTQSLALACMAPHLVRSVVLEDPAIFPVGRDIHAINARRDPWDRDLRRWLTMSHEELVAYKRGHTPHWSEEAMHHWAYARRHVDPAVLQWLDALGTSVWDWIHPIQVPMLMLSCEPNRGGVVQKDFVDALCAYLPHMKNVVIAHAAHEIHHDQPDAFIHAVRAFLK